jgi:hypothetical protein
MGTMPTPDAAPLPRLGEVFFDVRSAARSLRISWYADTGVAVLSIWQGGTCTGSFRLPMADLPRMIEALQRGPDGARDPVRPAGAAGYPAAPGRHPAPESAGGHYPDGSATREYPDGSATRDYPDCSATRDYPDGSATRDYPDGSATRDYPDGSATRDTGYASSAGDGLEPLPESFPYSLRLPDHELR